MDEQEFNKLLKKVSKDKKALEEIYGYYFARIVYYLTKKYGKEFAEDVAQDFFLWIFENALEIGEVKNPTSWVYKCVDNLAIDKIRKENKYTLVDEIVKQKVILPIREKYFDLYENLGKLDPDEKDLIEKIYWLGYSQKEIAEEMGVGYSAIRKRHSRIIKKLKEI